MKITIESTTQICELDGVKCRVWEGETEHGVKLHAFIPRVAAKDDQDLTQFEAELKEHKAPTVVTPLRMIL